MSNSVDINDVLSTVEHYFTFLHVGKYLSLYVKNNDITDQVKDQDIICENDSRYTLNGQRIRDSLKGMLHEKHNIIGYMVEWNSFRGISGAMKEGMDKNVDFKNFIESKMPTDAFLPFGIILSLIRNVFSHNIDNEIRLHLNDFKDTKKYFTQNSQSEEIRLSIKYYRDLRIFEDKPEYGFEIFIKLDSLQPGEKFIEIIPLFQLYMFSELCSNLVRLYREDTKKLHSKQGSVNE